MGYSKKRNPKNDSFWAYGGWEAVEKAMGSSDSKRSIIVHPPPLCSETSLYPDRLTEPATATAARGYTIIKREMELTENEANYGSPRDNGFLSALGDTLSVDCTEQEQLQSLKLILDGLKWRFQMQERFILVWQEMVKHGLLSMECVMRRIDIRGAMSSDTLRALNGVIQRFEYIQDLINGPGGRSERIPKGSLRGNFEHTTYWLSTLIARCGTNNIVKAVDSLETSQYFGPMSEEDPLDDVGDFEDVEDVDEVDVTEVMGPDESKYINCPKGEFSTLTNYRIGFIIPHGQNIRVWATLTAKRYGDVLNSYVEMGGAGWEMDPQFAAILQEFSQLVPSEYETVPETKREGM